MPAETEILNGPDGAVPGGVPAQGENGAGLVLRAPAKINLYLEVLGRRDNGYHDIRTVMAPISLYDTVTLKPIPHGVETVWENGREDDHSLVRSEDNLTTKAAHLMKDLTGHPGGMRIHLKKHIPVGGGLGGGSADAAAVLIGLNRLWNAGVAVETLMEIGFRLGCDVPAMVHGGVVCSEGLGEKVAPVVFDSRGGVGDHGAGGSWRVVLVNPGFSVATGDIYSRCRTSLTSEDVPIRSMVSALGEGDLDAVSGSLFNGLQRMVFAKYPLIEMIADGLVAAGARGVLLSGSGATVFGLAREEQHAREMAERLPEALGFSVWSEIASIVPDGVMVAHGPLEA